MPLVKKGVKMRILILTQWFEPEPAFKGLSFAKELTKLGHEVEVLTGFPNYPDGQIYDGYRIKPVCRETMDGIPVIRVPLYPSHDTVAFKRIINYLSFSFFAALLGTFLVKKADVMYVYHPPATVGLAASIISFFRRIPFVYDVQDLWPDTLAATGMMNHKGILKIVDRLCRFIYSRASRITVLSPGFKEILVQRGISSDKVEVIYNWCDETQLKPTSNNDKNPPSLGLTGRFNVVFAGTMGKAQALDAVIDAAGLLEERCPFIQFVFVGAGIEIDRLQQKKKDMCLKNVLFIPRQPVSMIGQILSAADVLLVHLMDDPLFEITIPSKTQAYMYIGRPILMGVKGDAAHLVEKAGAGIVCEPENQKSIADAVQSLSALSEASLNVMGDNGRNFYMRELAFNLGLEKYERLFYSVSGKEI